jgi:hypothetical protein
MGARLRKISEVIRWRHLFVEGAISAKLSVRHPVSFVSIDFVLQLFIQQLNALLSLLLIR